VTVNCDPQTPPPTLCGNGNIDPLEACDPNHPATSANCRPDCTVARCGDGIVDEFLGETCDDGNTVDTDDCTNQCRRSDETCADDSITCEAGLVCGKRCTMVDDTVCIGFVIDGLCIGIPMGDTYMLCDVDPSCMPASQASVTFD
jgi:cysteine-rich repeat protein